MTINILSSRETEEILASLQEQFGVKKIPGILLRIGQERIFMYQGSLSENEIKRLESSVPIERIGVYFAKEEQAGIRLSIEGSQILKAQIIKNIFELNESQVDQWMHGSELEVSTGKKGFLVMRYKSDFLGTGKASELKISNFIPKNRRLKERG
jgi:NOL1/NOP2/fmu family ribosome biogenesis protein